MKIKPLFLWLFFIYFLSFKFLGYGSTKEIKKILDYVWFQKIWGKRLEKENIKEK